MPDKKEQPQGKKKRNRSKKKRGGKGGGGGGNAEAPEGRSPRGSDGSTINVPPRQTQKPRNQTEQQQLQQNRRHHPVNPSEQQRALPTPSGSKMPPSTTEGVNKTSATTCSETPEEFREGTHHGTVGIADENDGGRRSRATPTREKIGSTTRHKQKNVETADTTARSITEEEGLARQAKCILVDEGMQRADDSSASVIAPFEGPQTSAPNNDTEDKCSKSPPLANHQAAASAQNCLPVDLERGDDFGSEGSYQSFQQGDEDAKPQPQTEVSDAVHPSEPVAAKREHRLVVTRTVGDPPDGASGQTDQSDGVLKVPATSNMSSPEKRSENEELAGDQEAEPKMGVSSKPMLLLPGRGRGGEGNQGGSCNGYGPGQNKTTVEGKAQSTSASTVSSRSRPAGQRSVRFEDDQLERHGVRNAETEEENEHEAEDQALLVPGSPTIKGSQATHDGSGGSDEGGARDASVQQEPAREEVMVDDIDDESTALLDTSPATDASRLRTPSQSATKPMDPEATATAAAAAAAAPAPSLPSLSPASMAKGGAPRAGSLASRRAAPRAATAASTQEATPPAKPPASETVVATSATAAAAAAAATFDYYKLPPIPEEALSEPSPGQPVPPDAPVRPAQRSSPVSRARPAKETDGLGGIWAAVRKSDTDGVRAELAGGATLDEADSEGRTPLMVACASGNTEMASLLVSGVSPPSSVAARTIEGWTPLMIASGGGRLGVVRALLQAGAALHDKDDEFGSNSFMWACGGGHAEVVRLMLDHGAKELLQSVNSDMWTPLMVACDAGSLETVQVLAKAGADLGAFNSDVQTARDIAASRKHLLLECYLRTEGAPNSAMFWNAADSGNAEVISRLLRGNGHLVTALDADGRTALLRTCIGGHLKVARVLVEAGADVDFQDSSGTSALSVSAVLGDMALTRYLVQAGGARLTAKNNAGWTPLMQAVAKGDLIMTRYLVDRGAAVNDGSPTGESVLDMAKRFSGAELQRYLAAKGGFSSHEVKRQIGEVNEGGRGLFRFW